MEYTKEQIEQFAKNNVNKLMIEDITDDKIEDILMCLLRDERSEPKSNIERLRDIEAKLNEYRELDLYWVVQLKVFDESFKYNNENFEEITDQNVAIVEAHAKEHLAWLEQREASRKHRVQFFQDNEEWVRALTTDLSQFNRKITYEEGGFWVNSDEPLLPYSKDGLKELHEILFRAQMRWPSLN